MPTLITLAPGWLDAVTAAVDAAAPGPAGNRLIAVDGFSGAGKSTRAAELAGHLGAPLLEIEDLYPGWHGLGHAPGLARDGIGEPLARGRTLRWTSWDWAHDRPGQVRERAPAPVVVLEGCGAGGLALAEVTSLLIWIDADDDVREARLHARPDWPGYAPFRDTWRRQELELAVRARTPQRADVVLVDP
ncbi:nucleoside/nucleotide kinase family protein [Pseudonocardia phyllosphaerae]|uniref:hypothetical protein n=1 Tax=Pseudonocardia phyllosphaerae TaxID=3390502 RepID=UPI00397C2CA6